ncbi:MAG: ADP-dependent NAD(P)H-hydrate dehydratase / NAD(P)H-hydrate epimerase [Solirubrobacteraceae bacterium]|nr:ADP-dependent NAD(P)H-hydrate dehydratase / NAD(P)H-hydrate epimerase [Solirubrobacteraceae bacterium]
MPALPDWLTPLPDAEQMRAIDSWAIERGGVAGIELMERAGAGVARAVERLAPDGPVTVVCGKGNNGGDGLVAARLLRDAGRSVSVVCVAPPAELSGDAQANLERLPGERPLRLDGSAWAQDAAPASAASAGKLLEGQSAIVDALLGTGFHGAPRGAVAEAIDAINAARGCVVSVDVPSGVDASSGVVGGTAVRASATVTFHAGKPGLWINPGKQHAGELETIDIGIPRGAPAEAAVGLIEASVLGALPRRGASSTKFDSGQVLVVGGSRGLTGAPRLSALASLRAGAGYVTACVPASLQAVLATGGPPEVMSRGLPDYDGSLVPDALEGVLEASERGGALALGPGLGRAGAAGAFARALALRARVPIVLDADGLNAHAGRLEQLRERSAPTVLTPHAGELGRLLELPSSEIERERLRHVRDAAARAGAVAVLKGDDTLVCDPHGLLGVSRGGSPALATAGTGDVLTGVIAALLAQGLEPFAAACAGVWLHAEAGREAARRVGAVEGVLASDVIDALPAARARGLREPGPIDVQHGAYEIEAHSA